MTQMNKRELEDTTSMMSTSSIGVISAIVFILILLSLSFLSFDLVAQRFGFLVGLIAPSLVLTLFVIFFSIFVKSKTPNQS